MSKQFEEVSSDELTEKTKNWWNDNPFTYLMDNKNINSDWTFFRNIDRKIIKWMPWAQTGYPLLSGVIDYKSLSGKKVLDIAVGTGWTTEQFIRAGADVTSIDLTPKAVELTKKRLSLYGLNSDKVMVADAQKQPFENETFDYVLAYGCLMHMPNTEKAISEIYRVLKPGGKASAMMYYKHSLHWWYFIYLSKGILRGKLLKMTAQELSNRYTDGVYNAGGNQLTKFYSKKEIRKLFGKFSSVKIRIEDGNTTIDHFPHRYLPIGRLFPGFVKKWLISLVGKTLWIDVQK
jgi:ubiquinone/menaquinone biosynthesis C-methylase UbiE